jgi:FkbM family methyltransferase
MFRVRSELDGQEFGDADAVSLMPLLRPIYDAHVQEALNDVPRVGGFVDVGANVGDVTASVLAFFSDHHRRFYRHLLTAPAAGPPLLDHVHHLQSEEALAFVVTVEASPPTLELLRRRAEGGAWEALSGVRVVHAAVVNDTAGGAATFCHYRAGSDQSSLLPGGRSGAVKGGDGERNCTRVPVATLVDLVGDGERVFLLKVDVEGAEAAVLAGGAALFKAQRVSFVVFENHSKWRAQQEVMRPGAPFVSVGDVAAWMKGWGYDCWYIHALGLIPFEVAGTPGGERERADCGEGLPWCARARLYDRQFWSNVLCAAMPAERGWMEWLADAAVRPGVTKRGLLREE